MLRTISAVIIYLCINIVTGTLAGIPTIEKLIKIDLLNDPISIKARFLWYGVGIAIISILYLFYHSDADAPKVHLLAAFVLIVLWIGSAINLIHFFKEPLIPIDSKFSFLVQYYIITIAIAISTQLMAIQAIDKVWELLDRAS